jgi:hypothetical protein
VNLLLNKKLAIYQHVNVLPQWVLVSLEIRSLRIVYELNRVMMAVAQTDGEITPEIDGESWAGRHNIAAPYTEIEQKMLEKAYKAVGSKHYDLNKGDLESQEHPAVNTTSPVQAFKGY